MKNYLYTIILSFFISGCTPLSLSTDYDETINFSSLKTYRWHVGNEHNAASLKYLNPLMDKRIRTTIDKQLQAQNYTKVGTEQVDFLVNYSVVVEDKTDIHTYNNYGGMYPGYGYYGGYYRGYGVGYSSETQVSQYKSGTLIIDIINPETDKLMWRGAADGRLPKGADNAEKDTLTQKYVTKILSNFPPKKK